MLRYWASATYFCQIIETVLMVFIVVLAFTVPELGQQWFSRAEKVFLRLSRCPRQATIGVIAALIVARLLFLPLMRVPEPSIHDEFSYLLAAKTFAAGRLTNAPDPFWRHFESVHIIQQPTYMSMYPPGQGLILGAGIWSTGKAWSGVVLSVGLLGGALFWALSGWFPRHWALILTTVTAVRWLLFSYWMNSYWGGALPALGGALVFGSLPRLAEKANPRDALLMGLGFVLLANTRPYEGLVVSLISVAILIAWSRHAGTLRRLFRPAVSVPLAGVIVFAAGALLYYDARVTGNALTLPYAQDRGEYAIAPLFLWGHLRPEPAYGTGSLRNVYAAEVELYQEGRMDWGIPEFFRKLKNFWIFFLGSLLSVPFIAFGFVLRRKGPSAENRKVRYIAIILSGMLVADAQIVWFYPHYFAPAFAPFVAVLLLGFRELRRWCWRGRKVGMFLSRTIPIGCLLMASIPASAHRLGWRLSFWPLQWALGTPAEIHGPKITSSILAEGKKALVFVQYGPNHDPGFEWIYNEPDIEHARIVWARSIDPKSDAALMRHFRDRSIWILQPDEHPAILTRLYPPRPKPAEIASSSTW